MTQWLVADTSAVKGGKIEHTIPERPLLHACCANDHFGDANIDIRPEVHPDKVCDVTEQIPYSNDSFAAAFADFPWIESWRFKAARAINELSRVAPIVYTISPWLFGTSKLELQVKGISQRPGMNHPILFVRYSRA